MELVFYDIETTIPATDMIEFGAIVLDRVGLYEKERYETLINSKKISEKSIACNGITEQMTKSAPTFSDVADNIFNVLHKKIWAGHNITNFDNKIVTNHFEKIGRKPPEPVQIIDTLPLIRETFGPRGGDLKMATLGKYFGLGQEKHRAIEDCQMTIEVLKKCCMTLFLEEKAGCNAMINQSINFKTGKSDYFCRAIDQAIEKEKSVWISYKGGSNPMVPRQIKPIGWDGDFRLLAFCFQSRINKYFSKGKIVDLREQRWEI